jgi:predicted Zn-dependent protease
MVARPAPTKNRVFDLVGRERPKPEGDPLVARDVHMLICAYLAALDRNQIDQARVYLERASAASNLLFFPYNRALQLEQIYYTVWYAQDTVAAREMLKNETNVRNDQASFQRVLAALYCVEGKILQAKKAIAEARAALSNSQHSGVAVAEADWLNEIEAAVLELEVVPHQPMLENR